jgi:hypothetical protein
VQSCVLYASVVNECLKKTNHRDTEDTETARRNSPGMRLFVQSRFKGKVIKKFPAKAQRRKEKR